MVLEGIIKMKTYKSYDNQYTNIESAQWVIDNLGNSFESVFESEYNIREPLFIVIDGNQTELFNEGNINILWENSSGVDDIYLFSWNDVEGDKWFSLLVDGFLIFDNRSILMIEDSLKNEGHKIV
jgi:hypothetical protein